jgi:hypothetical protein
MTPHISDALFIAVAHSRYFESLYSTVDTLDTNTKFREIAVKPILLRGILTPYRLFVRRQAVCA